MKAILIISAVFPPEPVVSSRLSFDIATELSKDCRVVVLHPEATRPLGFDFKNSRSLDGGFENITIPSYVCPQSTIMGRFRESYSFGVQCLKYIKKHYRKLACVYVNSWPLCSQFLIVKAAKKYGIPCIIHVQDIYPESFTNRIKIEALNKLLYKILLPLDKYILTHATQVLAISANMKLCLAGTRKIGRDKITIVENWQDERSFIAYNKKSDHKERVEDRLTFMYLGNNGPVAGVEFLITCFAKARLFNSRLVIAGSGSRKEACKELASNYSDVCVEFWDVPDGKVPEVQDQADVMLLPVKKGAAMSSIPSKLPAYMFSSKVIIGALDLESDTAKAIMDSNCGLVVEPENEQQLIDALQKVSEWSVQMLKEKGKNGFDYAINRFSRKQNLPLITNLIRNYATDNTFCKKG